MVGHKVKIHSQQTHFLFGDSTCSWGYDTCMSCGWKEGFGWGEEVREKGSVKQTIKEQTPVIFSLENYRLKNSFTLLENNNLFQVFKIA